MLGSLILYLKGMRIMMFQLSGYYYSWEPRSNATPYCVRFQPPAGRPDSEGFGVGALTIIPLGSMALQYPHNVRYT